jgi:competence ComEA-like helix-hairpin-helix protein
VRLPAEQEHDYLEPESLGGVNINTAGVEQLLTLSGVTDLLARTIVSHREENGPFRSIFDLINVPRLGRTTFRRITGMPFSENHLHRRRKLSMLLGLPASKVGDLPEVAAALTRVPGLAGCVISDRDGLLLAESGAGDFATAMSAVAPKMFRLMYECMTVVNVGAVDSVSFCISERMFTIVSSDRLSLTVVHETNRLTKTQIVMIQKVAAELTWLLSHRAYVGKTV